MGTLTARGRGHHTWIIMIPSGALCLGKQLYSGTHSIVFHGSLWGTPVVCKANYDAFINDFEEIPDEDGSLASFSEECRLLSRLSHPSIVQTIGCVNGSSGRPMWLVFEAAACNLEQYLKKAGKVSLATLQLWVSSILRGLAFLHSSPLRVQHLDLKPANILLFCDGTVAKLCDFEFASAAPCPSSDVPFPLSPRGSPLYTAPEIIAGVCDPNGKSDMFSFGVLVSELVTGYLTGATTGTRFVLDESTRFDVAESAVLILGGFWPAMAPILSRCVSVDPMDRPTATTALACLFPVDPPAVSTSEEDV